MSKVLSGPELDEIREHYRNGDDRRVMAAVPMLIESLLTARVEVAASKLHELAMVTQAKKLHELRERAREIFNAKDPEAPAWVRAALQPFVALAPVRSPYKESATISANHIASEPCSGVVLKLTATKSMMTHKMLLHEVEEGVAVIHKIETDHGGERKSVDRSERPMPAFSVAAYNGSSAPIHDGPYFGRLDPGESLYFTVEFLKPGNLLVAVMGPLCRTET